jgi:outer membrane protein assembly factor BamB
MPGILAAYSADHLSGAAVTGSNLCVQGDDVYVHDKDRCYRLDAAGGKTLGTFAAPAHRDGTPGQWGYLACDGELLYGTLANPKHVVRFGWRKADMTDLWSESTAFFALDAKTGKLRWRYDAADSIRHNAIAVSDGTVYLIDRKISEDDKLDPSQLKPDGKLPAVAKVNHPEGTLIALDKHTGRELWKRAGAFGTMLVYNREHDALLMGYQSTRFKIPSEVGGRLAVYRARTGDELWNKAAKYVTRPFINDDAVYAQGGAWELLTGVERPFKFDRSYGCGQISASKNMMLFRSATLGYRSLSPEAESENFGGLRPGCWINALPVGGLVLVPDASAGCTCSYQNRSWMALEGDD